MTVSLRPFLPADAPALIDIFRAAIEEIASEDYDSAQLEAWTAKADDEGGFTKKLASQLTLIGLVDGAVAGFASLKGADVIDLLYVHPRYARRRVGSILCEALEKLAGARGASKISVDASDTAQPLFEKRGYLAIRRNTIPLGDVWLGNTTMQKPLAANDAQAAAGGRLH